LDFCKIISFEPISSKSVKASSNYEGVRPVVNIRMSPQFAKEFSRIMSENVVNYEERFGKIVSQDEGRKQ